MINIFLFFLLKYILLFLYFMIERNDFTFFDLSNIRQGEDLFYFLWLLLFLPVSCFILFSIPLYFSFRTDRIFLFLLIVLSVFACEYYFYVRMTSDRFPSREGLINAVLSILFFLSFFLKSLKRTFLKSEKQPLIF